MGGSCQKKKWLSAKNISSGKPETGGEKGEKREWLVVEKRELNLVNLKRRKRLLTCPGNPAPHCSLGKKRN